MSVASGHWRARSTAYLGRATCGHAHRQQIATSHPTTAQIISPLLRAAFGLAIPSNRRKPRR
jgi:hypothetical protein